MGENSGATAGEGVVRDAGNAAGTAARRSKHGLYIEATNTRLPQRIRFPFDIHFATATLGAFPLVGNPPIQEVLNAVVNVGGNALRGASAATEFELVSGADPYFTDIDPAQNNDFWLSRDLRVFTAVPGLNATPVAGAPSFSSDSINGAYSYIQSLLGFLNNPANHFTDGTNDPFSSVIPNQTGALTTDSSVSRFTIRSLLPLQLFNNYNFAIARVRLRGSTGTAGQAQNVKVFFRMWSTQTADTGFDPNSTYLSHNDAGKPHWPLPAPDSHTIPFFATGNTPNLSDPGNPEYGTAGINNQTITIASGNAAFAYFGCFLNVYDSGNVVNGSQVQALLAGTHHCLVAQLAYDDAPVVNANGLVASPESSDKLAQRNLQLTLSDNPGPPETHRIPQTFELKPGRAALGAPGRLLDYPDELMIDWGNVPVGSIAHIYWPQLSALKVLELANGIYATHRLSASDSHTVDCTVERGVAYVPIPNGTTENIAGLLTLDLPQTVTVGQQFKLLVRRVSTRQLKETPQGPALRAFAPTPPASKPDAVHGGGTIDSEGPALHMWADALSVSHGEELPPVMRNWRYIVGTFQVTIPVTTREVMLRPDEDTLAVMKWRLEKLALTNRWHPVLVRYISYLSARVTGLGGDPDAIPASLDGAPHGQSGASGSASYTGRVVEVFYDCFGHFEGFVLAGCCDKHTFPSRDPRIAELALRACKDNLLLTVHVDDARSDCLRKLAIHT